MDLERALLPGLPAERIRAPYTRVARNEIGTGKFGSPESSAALVANVFGAFLDEAQRLPPLPGTGGDGWPALDVQLD